MFEFFSFDIFSSYLTGCKKFIKVKQSVGGRDVVNLDTGNVVTAEEQDMEVYLGKSSYNSICSAIMYLYRLCDVEMDGEFQRLLTRYIAGMKRTVAQEKKETGQKLDEGKREMPVAVYKKIVRFFFMGNQMSIFLHVHFILLSGTSWHVPTM